MTLCHTILKQEIFVKDLYPPPLPPLETFMKKMNRKCIWLEFFFKSKECNSVENGSLPKTEVDLDIIMINL